MFETIDMLTKKLKTEKEKSKTKGGQAEVPLIATTVYRAMFKNNFENLN